MATVAICIGGGEVVVVVDMALRTGGRDMRAGQWPTRCGVIERGGRPGDCVVAARTIRGGKGRAGSRVRGIIRLLPGREMAAGVAAIARLNGQVVIIVDVAGAAGNARVSVCQRESRARVIEIGLKKRIESVAALTIG